MYTDMLCGNYFAGGPGISHPYIRYTINSTLCGSLGRGRDVISLPMVGAREAIVAEDPSPTMKDFFGDVNLEG